MKKTLLLLLLALFAAGPTLAQSCADLNGDKDVREIGTAASKAVRRAASHPLRLTYTYL